MNRRFVGVGLGRRMARSMSGGGGAPVDPNLSILLNSGAFAFWDHGWEDGLALRESSGTQYVTAMQDRINGHVVAQATEAQQPVWGALSPSGKRGISCDGTFLISADGAATWKFLHVGNAEVLAALKYDASVADNTWIWGTTNNATSSGSYAGIGAPSIRLINVASDASSGVALSVTGAVNTPALQWCYVDGAGGTVGGGFGLAEATPLSFVPRDANPTHTLCVGARGGGNNGAKCELYGLLIYDRVLSSSSRATIHAAFRSYYGVT